MSELYWWTDDSGEHWRVVAGGERANGRFVARNADGSVRRIVTCQGGRLHGESREYFPDGTLKMDGFYHHGRSAGALREWYPNGQLREEFLSTDDGMKLLRHREWREDGTLKYDSNPARDAGSESQSTARPPE